MMIMLNLYDTHLFKSLRNYILFGEFTYSYTINQIRPFLTSFYRFDKIWLIHFARHVNTQNPRRW